MPAVLAALFAVFAVELAAVAVELAVLAVPLVPNRSLTQSVTVPKPNLFSAVCQLVNPVVAFELAVLAVVLAVVAVLLAVVAVVRTNSARSKS